MRNRDAAEYYFIKMGKMPRKEDRKERWVLHHKDYKMIYEDPQRYEEWNVEDLEPMTFKEHQQLHMKIRIENKDTDKYGKPKTEDEKKYLSECLKGRPSPNKGNTFHKSPEAIERTRQAHIGKHWYTNGIINVKAFECPKGFHPGMTRQHRGNS